MRDGLKEPIGSLCRWLLLAVAAGIAAGGAWVGALAACEAVSGVDAIMVVPDAVLPDPPKGQWRGWIHPPGPHGFANAALSYRQGGPAIFTPTYGRRILPQVDKHHAGVNRVTIKGNPYSAFAYQRTEAMLCIVSPQTDVFLLDPGMALSAADPGQLAECLAELRSRGQPAFFHPGPMREFVEVRRRLRKLESGTPVVWEMMGDPEAFAAVIQFTSRLKRLRPGGPKPFVVTADVVLARRAGRKGLTTYLIAAPPAEALPGEVHQFESLAKFKEYLAGRPISQ